MELVFIIEDIEFYSNSGIRPPQKKVVTITLTEDQLAKLPIAKGEAVTELFIKEKAD